MKQTNQDKPLIINHFNPESRSQILSHAPLLSSQNLGWKNVNFDYFQYDTYEAPAHQNNHHVIVISYQQYNVERKLDGVFKREHIHPGSVVIIPKKAEHWTAWKEKISFGLFSIPPSALADIAPETVNPDRVELIPAFSKSEPDHLISGIGMAIKHQLETDPHGCSFYVEHLMNAMSAHLLKNYCTIKPKLKNYGDGLSLHKLKLAINYIHDNLDRSITLTELANLVDISQFYFCRLFRESTGVSPYQYVIQQRVTKAQQLISHSTMPLINIAFDCGFSSQSQMTHHFRKLTGMTPKKYRDLAPRGGRTPIPNSVEHFF